MIGTLLSIRYELLNKVGESPIFEVYQARDRVKGKDVTIRVFRPPFSGEPEFLTRASETIDRYSRFGGPGVEAMVEVDDDQGVAFLVSEFTSAQSLQERIDKLAPFSVSVAVSTTISICEGLNSLHVGGAAHGDVSAKSIAVMPDGQCRLQLVGFWEAYSGSQTAGMVALPAMAAYLAPEVSAGSLPSPSSDVYSLGVLLYQLLSGRLPYSADNPVALAMKHATAGIPSVRIFNNAVPNALDEIVKKAMAKDPSVRYSSAGDLLSDLRMLQDGLRFGKAMQWPLKPAAASADKQPVAPKMSAIREPETADVKKKKDREPRDVPIWLVALFGIGAAVFIGLIVIWVVFNVSQPKLVSVPNVKGSKLSEARKTLDNMGLKLRISGRETNDLQPPDTILDMAPPAGSKRHEGATVNVRISTGSRFVTLPDLRGITLDKAKAMLEAINLTLSDSHTTQTDPSLETGLIISQSPDAKAKVERFARVSVVVSSGKSGGSSSSSSNEDKQYLYNLTIKLTGLTEDVVLRVDILDTKGERTIYENSHKPDDAVQIPAQGFGKEATFKIYYDNQLVTTKEKKAEEEAPSPN